jgi:hypothetical protein
MYRATLAVLFAALVPAMMAAQVKAFDPGAVGRVAGTVMNTKGKALPGTTVTLSGEAPVVRRTAITDKKGAYRFDDVPVGRYTVTAELATFIPATRTAVVAEGDVEVALRLFLSVAEPVVTAPRPERAPRPVLVPFDR